MTTPYKKIIVFLTLTLSFSLFFYALIASTGKLEAAPTLGLMWSPGVAALITQLLFQRSLRGFGWKPRKVSYLLFAYLLPAIYGLGAYAIIWLTGLGRFDATNLLTQISTQIAPQVSSPIALIAIYLGVVVTMGTLQSILSATGEEIGWRGLLVPELAKVTSFTKTALISGAIWAVWHYPLLFLANYHNEGAPVWFGLICFTILVVSGSFMYAWLRLKTDSLWPAILLHASHNLFIQNVFDPLTGNTTLTPYFIGEFGIMLALVAVVPAFLLWRRRGELMNAASGSQSLGMSVAVTDVRA